MQIPFMQISLELLNVLLVVQSSLSHSIESAPCYLHLHHHMLIDTDKNVAGK